MISKQENYQSSLIMRRAGSLLLDYLIWYMVYSIMVLGIFLRNNGSPTVSGNLMYYKEAFDNIIKTPLFSITYLGIICLLEIIIPIITGGQSITKKIFKLKVIKDNNSNMTLILRSIIKIIVLNPYGVIAYLVGNTINTSMINIISNILSVIFIFSIILVFKDEKSLHDKFSRTYVKLNN